MPTKFSPSLKIFAVLSFLIFCSATTLFISAKHFSAKKKSLSANQTQPTNVETSVELEPLILANIFNDQHDKYVMISDRTNKDGSKNFTYDLFGIDTGKLQDNNFLSIILSDLKNSHPLIELKNSPEFVKKDVIIKWAPSGDKFLIYGNEQIILYAIEEESHENNKILAAVEKAQIPLSVLGTSLDSMFFSGDNSELYITVYEPKFQKDSYTKTDNYDTGFGTYRIDLSSINLKPQLISLSEAYALPNSKGYAVFSSDSKPYEQLSIKLVYPNKELNLPIDPHDYAGNIVLSPNRDKVCFESGSSNGNAYTVFSITQKKIIQTGIEYSYCERWLDNNDLFVIENPYKYGSPADIKDRYLFNTKDKKITFISKFEPQFP